MAILAAPLRLLRRNGNNSGIVASLLDDRVEDGFYRPASGSSGKSSAKPIRGDRETGSDREGHVPRHVRRVQDDSVPGRETEGFDPDLDSGSDVPFLRTRQRVRVRKGPIPQSIPGRIVLGFAVALGIAGTVLSATAARKFLHTDPRFRVQSSSSIRILGNTEVTRSELLAVFAEDISRNIFFVPLEERRRDLELLPWVEHATVMRILPDQLRVAVTERTPIAFVQIGRHPGLIDANGVILDMPAASSGRHYSFPVLTGVQPTDPLTRRAAQMQLYTRFIHELESANENIPAKLSEVDLSDPEDVAAVIADGDKSLLVHFGDEQFLDRFHAYQAHLAEWRSQYPNLASADMRYEHQAVLQMDKSHSVAVDPAGDSRAKNGPNPSVVAAGNAHQHAAPEIHGGRPAPRAPQHSAHVSPRSVRPVHGQPAPRPVRAGNDSKRQSATGSTVAQVDSRSQVLQTANVSFAATLPARTQTRTE